MADNVPDGGDAALAELLAEMARVATEDDAAQELPQSEQPLLPAADIAACARVLQGLLGRRDNVHKAVYRTLRATITALFTEQIASRMFGGQSFDAYVKRQVRSSMIFSLLLLLLLLSVPHYLLPCPPTLHSWHLLAVDKPTN